MGKFKEIYYVDQEDIEDVRKNKGGLKNVGAAVSMRKDPIVFDVMVPYYEVRIGKLIIPKG